MSKKKDPNDIRFSAALRSNELTRKRLHKRIPKDMDYLHRVADEYADLEEKILKLGYALWRTEKSGNGDEISVYTALAKSLKGDVRQLLVRQHKTMKAYSDILVKRLKLFKADIFTPKH